jgi:hypothetical protein
MTVAELKRLIVAYVREGAANAGAPIGPKRDRAVEAVASKLAGALFDYLSSETPSPQSEAKLSAGKEALDEPINWKARATTAEAERDEARAFIRGDLQANLVEQGARVADALPWKVRATEAERLLEVARGALEKAERFIANGVDLGFIRMPDAGTPDPAHATLPAIREALSVLSGGRDLNGSRDHAPNTSAATPKSAAPNHGADL